MMRIVEYKVIVGSSVEITSTVQKHLDDGWFLKDPLFKYQEISLCQNMVRYQFTHEEIEQALHDKFPERFV